MIRAAVIAVLMLTAAVTGAVAFDHYRPAKVIERQFCELSQTVPEYRPPSGAPHEAAAKPKHTNPVVHKPLHILGKRYPGDDSANELNLRELR